MFLFCDIRYNPNYKGKGKVDVKNLLNISIEQYHPNKLRAFLLNGGFSKKVSSPEYPNLNWKPKLSRKSKKIKKVKKPKKKIHICFPQKGNCYWCNRKLKRRIPK